LPFTRIKLPEVGDKVFFEKGPALTGFCGGDFVSNGASSHLFLAEFEQVCRLLQVQSVNQRAKVNRYR